MKRVYKSVSTEAVPGGWIARLDKRELLSPAKAPLIFPTERLAVLAAGEWDAQKTDIRPDTMPINQLAATAVDLVARKREEIVDATAAYAGTDLVCYRATSPAGLAERQASAWDPLLDWALSRYDAPLEVHTGVSPKPQPPASLAAYRRVVATLDDWTLSAVQTATHAAGSLIVALAMLERRLDAEGAFAASQVDETWQIEKWGEDFEATACRARLRGDLAAAVVFLDALTG